MSRKKKLFTLIRGDHIHIGPEAKVLKAKDFSEALDAKEMLVKVKDDADQYIKDVTNESEKIKETAQREGFEEGFSKWSEQIAFLESVREDQLKMVIPVALSAAKKILGRESELSKDIILDIVSSNLKAVTQHKKIKIYVNRDELDALEKNKDNLKKMFEHLESLSLIERNDIEPGGCVIETEGGIINAQLENQWNILEQAFKKVTLSKIKEEAGA